MRQRITNFVSLFGSLSTLICCALPAMLVSLGAGAVVASIVSTLPWLAWLTRYKEWLFVVAGLLIALNFALVYRPRGEIACAVGGGKACEDATWLNKIGLWVSAGIYTVGLVMAYAALPIRKLLEQ